MDLYDVLQAALAEHRDMINEDGRKWADHPVKLEISWHSRMSRVEITVNGIHHLPPYRIPTD